jgi:hypothetical protein
MKTGEEEVRRRTEVWTVGRTLPPHVLDVRSSAKMTGFTSDQALFPNMAVSGNRGKQTKCATLPPLAAQLSIVSNGGKATSQIHRKATTKLHGG